MGLVGDSRATVMVTTKVDHVVMGSRVLVVRMVSPPPFQILLLLWQLTSPLEEMKSAGYVLFLIHEVILEKSMRITGLILPLAAHDLLA